jgi:hypothetical protein
MRVIEEKPFNVEFECRCCKSKLQAEPEDVKIGYFGANYGGDTPDREYYVTCPVCGTDKILKHNELTPKVRELADSKEKK